MIEHSTISELSPSFRYSCSPAKLERAKARVKRLNQPFTVKQLREAMRANPHTVYGAIERMLAQGWITDEGIQGACHWYRYQPAPEVPTARKRNDPPMVTGRGRAYAANATVPGTGGKRDRGEIGRLVSELRKQGWTVEKRDHYKVTKGEHVVILPKTPSDRRSLANAKADLRKRGARI